VNRGSIRLFAVLLTRRLQNDGFTVVKERWVLNESWSNSWCVNLFISPPNIRISHVLASPFDHLCNRFVWNFEPIVFSGMEGNVRDGKCHSRAFTCKLMSQAR